MKQYVALCDASKEALFTRAVLVFLQSDLTGMRVDVFGNNEGAKAIANNPSVARLGVRTSTCSSILSGDWFARGKFVSCTWERRSSMPMY